MYIYIYIYNLYRNTIQYINCIKTDIFRNAFNDFLNVNISIEYSQQNKCDIHNQ